MVCFPKFSDFHGKVTSYVAFNKTHPSTVTKKSSKPFVKLLEHPQRCLDLFTYTGPVFLPYCALQELRIAI